MTLPRSPTSSLTSSLTLATLIAAGLGLGACPRTQNVEGADSTFPKGDAGAGEGGTSAVTRDGSGRVLLHPGVWRSADCPACIDADADGITDDAETFLLRALVPGVVLLGDEPALDGPGAAIVSVGRVALAPSGSRLRVFLMLGYVHDFGSCGFTAHPGDSERVAFDLEVVDDASLRLRRAYTAAHEGEATDRSRLVAPSELASVLQWAVDDAGSPHPLVYSSRNKHATYVNEALCAEAFAVPCFVESCAPNPRAGVVVRPAVHNAGEAGAPLLDDLTDLGWAGESAWADQPFCGGQRALAGTDDEGCASPVFEKLTADPFL